MSSSRASGPFGGPLTNTKGERFTMPFNLKLDFRTNRLNKKGYQDEGREDSRNREGRPEKKQKAIDSARVAREARARNKARR